MSKKPFGDAAFNLKGNYGSSTLLASLCIPIVHPPSFFTVPLSVDISHSQ